MNILNGLVLNAGLGGLVNNLKNDWIGPAFLLIIAGVIITFLLQREIRKLIIFVGIAALVGVLIFGGAALFGSDGSLTKVATREAGNINAILTTTSWIPWGN